MRSVHLRFANETRAKGMHCNQQPRWFEEIFCVLNCQATMVFSWRSTADACRLLLQRDVPQAHACCSRTRWRSAWSSPAGREWSEA